MSRQEKLAELFLPDLKHDQNRLIRIPSLNIPEIRPQGTFSQFYQTATMEMMTVTKILTLAFTAYFQVL